MVETSVVVVRIVSPERVVGQRHISGGLAKPVSEVGDGSCNPDAFDEMEAYIATIRPAHGLVRYDELAFERGREVFIEGGCNNCHGGERSKIRAAIWNKHHRRCRASFVT